MMTERLKRRTTTIAIGERESELIRKACVMSGMPYAEFIRQGALSKAIYVIGALKEDSKPFIEG